MEVVEMDYIRNQMNLAEKTKLENASASAQSQGEDLLDLMELVSEQQYQLCLLEMGVTEDDL